MSTQLTFTFPDTALGALPPPAQEAMEAAGVDDAWRAADLTCPYCTWPIAESMDIVGHDVIGFPCCHAMQERLTAAGFWEALESGRDRREVLRSLLPGAPVRRVRGPDSGLGEWTCSLGLRTEIVSKTEVMDAIDRHHRHHDAPHMAIVGLTCYNGSTLVGVATLSTPTSRKLMETGEYLELNRAAVWSDPFLRHNAISKLSAAARQAARQLRHEARQALTAGPEAADNLPERARKKYKRRRGAHRLRTYILDEEDGHSWKAAGWEVAHTTSGGTWDRPSRRRERKPHLEGAKVALDTEF